MHWTLVFHTLGYFFLFFSLCFLPSLAIALIQGETLLAEVFFLLVAINLSLGLLLALSLRRRARDLYFSKREGLVVVSLIWLLAGLIGALPFWISGAIDKPVSAIFESVSGFTTTGSSVLTDIESLPSSLLFWRSLTHYLGGLGIVVLLVAILPYFGMGARVLFQEESSGLDSPDLKPRIQDTAMTLLKIYLVLTVAETALLYLFGMSFFDSLCHTFGTLATGGFSTKNASIGHYDSLAIELTIVVFMLLAAINFSLYYHAVKGRLQALRENTELKFFLTSVTLATLAIALHLTFFSEGSFWWNLRRSLFQVASIHTATGFATDDYEQWTTFSQLTLVFLMLIGGSAGSTAGGIKMVRLVIVLRYIWSRIKSYFHPHGTFVVRLNGRPLSERAVYEALGLFCLWLFIIAWASLCLTAMGLDLATALSSTITTMGGVGPGLGLVGPVENFSVLPEGAKGVLILCMLFGRLEIYTLLVIFLPAFWKE